MTVLLHSVLTVSCYKQHFLISILPSPTSELANQHFTLGPFLCDQPFFQDFSPAFSGFHSPGFRISPKNFSSCLPKIWWPFFWISSLTYYTIIIHITHISNFFTLYPLYTHLHPVFPFLHLTFNSCNNKYYIHLLFFFNSSLLKQPFVTAHFRSSLHILCITAC